MAKATAGGWVIKPGGKSVPILPTPPPEPPKQAVAWSGVFSGLDMPNIVIWVLDTIEQCGGLTVTEGSRKEQLLAAACGMHLGADVDTSLNFTDQELNEGLLCFRQDMAAFLNDLKYRQENSGGLPLDMYGTKSRSVQLLSAGGAHLIGWSCRSDHYFTDWELKRVHPIFEGQQATQ